MNKAKEQALLSLIDACLADIKTLNANLDDWKQIFRDLNRTNKVRVVWMLDGVQIDHLDAAILPVRSTLHDPVQLCQSVPSTRLEVRVEPVSE